MSDLLKVVLEKNVYDDTKNGKMPFVTLRFALNMRFPPTPGLVLWGRGDSGEWKAEVREVTYEIPSSYYLCSIYESRVVDFDVVVAKMKEAGWTPLT